MPISKGKLSIRRPYLHGDIRSANVVSIELSGPKDAVVVKVGVGDFAECLTGCPWVECDNKRRLTIRRRKTGRGSSDIVIQVVENGRQTHFIFMDKGDFVLCLMGEDADCEYMEGDT